MVLVVVSGLPGVGKSTVARGVASALDACWLEIDVLEAPFLARFDGDSIGWAGYEALTGLAEAQLSLGSDVVIDSVAWTRSIRAGWTSLAAGYGAACRPIEVICSDRREHRRRIEAEPGKRSWNRIERARAEWWEPWEGERLVVDTAAGSPETAVAEVVAYVAESP